ncbi:MAG: hypothetical protein ACI9UK_000902 [Candidatus Krumholzibacteriia bacterium]|jgi:hypothetical protein
MAKFMGIIRPSAASGMVTVVLILSILAVTPQNVYSIIEPGSEQEYPDEVMLNDGDVDHELVVTGAGLREKSFMKFNVYAIASYIAKGTDLGENMGATMIKADVAKELRMNLLRSFSAEKLTNSFSDVINDNYDDTSAFAQDMKVFLAYFVADAQEGDVLKFSYLPGKGLTTKLNGEELGVITNVSFVEALWTVWFGQEPADKGLRDDMLSKM